MFGDISGPRPLGNINNADFTFSALTITGNQSAFNPFAYSLLVTGNSFLNGVVTSKFNTLDDGTSAISLANIGNTTSQIGKGAFTGLLQLGGNAVDVTANSTGSVSIGNALNSVYIGSQSSLNSIVNIQPGTGSNTTNIGATSGYSGTISIGNASSTLNILGATNINTSGNGAINIGTGSYSGALTFGNASMTGFNINVSGISAGINITQAISGGNYGISLTPVSTTASYRTAIKFGNGSLDQWEIGTDSTATKTLDFYLYNSNQTKYGFKVTQISSNLSFATQNNTLDSGSGAATFAGLITGNAGLTVSGATNINTSGSSAINIGTGTYTGQITISNTSSSLNVLCNSGLQITDNAFSVALVVNSNFGNNVTSRLQVNGVNRYDIEATNLTASFSIRNSSGAAILQQNGSNDLSLLTQNNTLDDGSGNQIINGQGVHITPNSSNAGGLLIGYATGTAAQMQLCTLDTSSGAAANFYGSWIGTGLGYFKTNSSSEPTNPWTIYTDGAGYGFAGIISSWGGLQFFHQPKVGSASNGSYTNAQLLAQEVMRITSFGVKTFKGTYFTTTSSPVVSAGNQTITAAQLLNMVVESPVQSAGFTWTTDTGTNIYNAMGSPAVGTSFWVKYANSSNSFACTVAFGSGVTGNLDGNTISTNSEKILIFRCTGTNTFTVY